MPQRQNCHFATAGIHSSYNIQLLFFAPSPGFMRLHIGFDCDNWAGIATLGAMGEASLPLPRNLHNLRGDKPSTLLRLWRSTRSRQPPESTAINGVFFTSAFSPLKVSVGQTKR